MFVCSFYRFHLYFHIQIIPNLEVFFLTQEDDFYNVKNSYIKSAYYSICDNYGNHTDEKRMNVNWFYMPKYGAFSDKEKVTERSPSGNLTQWLVKGFKRKGIKKGK